ncbi:MAG: oligoendopeptidase F [Pleurocapsa minor GSE-CHR-MK-17-07R]|jgi:oligoendopeptidase F|nr:oligoendopeptidase F [Pleurocapsa minor GSE-CHR-MK 17-07R]
MSEAVKVPKRSEVPKEQTWNAESVFADQAAWKASYDAVMADIPALKAYEGRLGESAAVLLEGLKKSESLVQRAETIYFYPTMIQSCDSNDEPSMAMVGQAGGLFGRLLGALAFSEPEILAIGQEKLNRWMDEHPPLAEYRQYFDNLFRRQAHVRSAEVEEILGTVSEVFGQIDNTYEMLTSSEMPFEVAGGGTGEKVPVTQGAIDDLYHHDDREVRRTAWQNYHDGYLKYKNTLASNYAAAVKRAVFGARARRYESALDASLFENNVPKTVFNNLIDTYKKHIPTWHRYWAAKRKALGVDKVYPWDVWAPMAQQPNVSFKQAVDWIAQGMAPLGQDYVDTLVRGCLNDRWVDYSANEGKRQGAFSYGTSQTAPFIMMTWGDTLMSMSTLAHELGHSMHSYYSRKTQPYAYTNYSLFVAEVASNFNQALVRDHLMRTNTDPKFQIALIDEAMNNIHRYFFIMPTLARFEAEMHERVEAGEGLTAELLNSRMLALYQEGYGDELDPDGDRTGITWATFPHLYANFYVYQYATGISAAHALAEKVLTGEASAAESYRQFLATGSSLYPLDTLKVAGVDMETPEAVEMTFGVLARYVDRLEELTS